MATRLNPNAIEPGTITSEMLNSEVIENIKSEIGGSLTEEDIANMGFTKNTGTYSKPSGGIPKTDLASAVQTSLGKADTALQSYTEQYKGTITGVSANGTSVATSGVANIPAASTSAYGVTKLSSATNSTSTTLAATASAVKSAYDLANSYKGTVTSVKLNGTTYSPTSGVVDLGTISGGSSDANVQAVDTGDVVDDVNVSYATTAYVDNKFANIELTDYATTDYVDGLIGDINSVLESIINGGIQSSTFPITLSVGDNGDYGVEVYNYLMNILNSDTNSYEFAENEILTVGNYTFSAMSKVPASETNSIIVFTPTPAGYFSVTLNNAGFVTMVAD